MRQESKYIPKCVAEQLTGTTLSRGVQEDLDLSIGRLAAEEFKANTPQLVLYLGRNLAQELEAILILNMA